MEVGKRLLCFSDVSHSFSGRSVLQHVNLNICEGDVVALVGPSGVGKSTLLNIALGLIEPVSGEVQSSFETRSCVFQEPRLIPWFSARRNIELGLKAKGISKKERKLAAESIGRQMGLTLLDLNKFPRSLSGGMARRIALARALAISPEILFLDEPFNAIDIAIKESLYTLLLHEIRHRSLTVLFVTHDLLEAVYLAKSIVVMQPASMKLSEPIPIDTPWAQRTPAWRFQRSADLLNHESFRQAFAYMHADQK